MVQLHHGGLCLRLKMRLGVIHYGGEYAAIVRCEAAPKGINILFYWTDILGSLQNNETVVTCAACLGTRSNGPT